MSRNYSLSGLLFASLAQTYVPPSPTVGIPYRNPQITVGEAGNGWPFSTVVNSADFNEVMYRITTLLNYIEKNGGITWSSLTDYEVGSLVRDENLTFYEAIQASGPNNGGYQVPQVGQYWKIASFHVYGGGYRVVFIGSNYNSTANELVYCRTGCTVALPINPADQDRVKIVTSDVIDENLPVIITGTAIQRSGITSIVMDEPISFIEFIWDQASSMWKIEGLVYGAQLIYDGSQIKLVPPINSIQDTQTIDLTISGQKLSADLRVAPNSSLSVSNNGLAVSINSRPDNSIKLVEGGLYSAEVNGDEVKLIEKQMVFFNGEGSQISLGELDVGTWDPDYEWPLVWDCGEIKFYSVENVEIVVTDTRCYVRNISGDVTGLTPAYGWIYEGFGGSGSTPKIYKRWSSVPNPKAGDILYSNNTLSTVSEIVKMPEDLVVNDNIQSIIDFGVWDQTNSTW